MDIQELIASLETIAELPERFEAVEKRLSDLEKQTKKQNPPAKKVLSLKEAAAYLGLSQRSIYRLIDRGLIKRNRGTSRVLIPLSQLEKYLEVSTF